MSDEQFGGLGADVLNKSVESLDDFYKVINDSRNVRRERSGVLRGEVSIV